MGPRPTDAPLMQEGRFAAARPASASAATNYADTCGCPHRRTAPRVICGLRGSPRCTRLREQLAGCLPPAAVVRTYICFHVPLFLPKFTYTQQSICSLNLANGALELGVSISRVNTF